MHMEWYLETSKTIQKLFGEDGRDLLPEQVEANWHPLPKNLLRTFEEKSKGNVHLCISKDPVQRDKPWPSTSVWAG